MTFYFHVHRQGRTITKSFGRTRDRAPKQAAGVAYFNEQGELLLCKRRTGINDHPEEWDSIFRGTLETILSDRDNAKPGTLEWFAQYGVKP